MLLLAYRFHFYIVTCHHALAMTILLLIEPAKQLKRYLGARSELVFWGQVAATTVLARGAIPLPTS